MTNSSDPAYPATIAMTAKPGDYISVTPSGLTKREYFAAMAMHGLLVSMHKSNIHKIDIVVDAIDLADVLIEKLNKA